MSVGNASWHTATLSSIQKINNSKNNVEMNSAQTKILFVLFVVVAMAKKTNDCVMK